jgi:AraC family transcriptional regulator of adaptative response / DNA-3-methyladenine glycosylase II
MTPSEVRRPNRTSDADGNALRVVLDVRAPFDAASAFAFLRARAVPGAETFAGNTYLRGVAMNGAVGVIAISPGNGRAAIVVEVASSLAPALMTIAARARRLFDSDADPTLIGEHLSRDTLLAKRVMARPALRVMGAFDPFEWAVRAVLGQQISVRAALTIAGRLLAKLGIPLKPDGERETPAFAWPEPARIADAKQETLQSIGLTRARAGTVLALARAVADRKLTLDASADPAVTREALLALPGIGPWTAQYIEMRALGWPDAFPAGDLGLRKALGGVSTAECEALSQRWRPWRAYAAAYLWLGLSEETG